MTPRIRSLALTAVACLIALEVLVVAQTAERLGLIVPLGFVPVVLVLEPARFFRTWGVLGLVAGVQTAGAMNWIATTGSGYVLLLPVLAVYAALPFGITAAVCRAGSPRSCPLGGLLVLPAGWALAELVTRQVGLCVSWSLAGMPLADWPMLAQGAAVGGPELLSFLVVAVGVAIALPIRGGRRGLVVCGVAQGVIALTIALVWGAIRLGAEETFTGTIRAAVVQPNIPNETKWSPSRRREILEQIDRLIDRSRDQNPDMIVLPETAVVGLVRFEADLTSWVKEVVERTGRPLLFGSLDQDERVEPRPLYNVAILITPYNTVTTYRKIKLVPVTERIPAVGPLRSWLVALRGKAPEFTPGDELTLFVLKGKPPFATVICYEDVFPDLARAFARRGAGAIFALVNTERFKRSSLARQQLRRARLSAIASGLPFLRCTNSGVSCLIDGKGRIVERIEGPAGDDLLVDGARVINVPLGGSNTPYRRLGDGLAFGLLAFLAAGAILLMRHRPGSTIATDSERTGTV